MLIYLWVFSFSYFSLQLSKLNQVQKDTRFLKLRGKKQKETQNNRVFVS